MIRLLPRILPPIEIISLVGLFVALALKYMQSPGGDEIIMISMSTLAAVYFLTAYLPIEWPKTDKDRKLGFFDLFARSITVKVMCIGMAITVVGTLYQLLHLLGAKEMLMVGCSALAAGIVIEGIYIVTNSEASGPIIRILYRAVPVCLIGIYLFLNQPA